MADDKIVVTLDSFEQRLLVGALTDFRNELIRGAAHGRCGRFAPEGH